MADAEATALLKVKADVRQAVDGIKGLEKAQHQLKRAVDDTGSSFTKFIDASAVGLAKFNLAVGGLQQGMALLKGGMDIAREVNAMERFERALPTGAIERMSRASQGLIDRQTQLRLGVKGLTGDFAITQTQMEKVMRAAVALEQKGFGPAAENADKLLDALAKGVNKLDDFGISLEKTGSRANDVNAAMGKFDELIESTGPLDDRTKALATLTEVLNDVANGIKSVVAAAVNGLASIVDGWKEYVFETQNKNNQAAGKHLDNTIATAHANTGNAIATLFRGGKVDPNYVSPEQNAAYWRTRAERSKPYSVAYSMSDEEYAAALGVSVGSPAFIEANKGYSGYDFAKEEERRRVEYERRQKEGWSWIVGRAAEGENTLLPINPFDVSYRPDAFDAGERTINALGGLVSSPGLSLSGAFGGPGGFGVDRLKFGDGDDPMAKLRGKAGTAFKDFGLDVAADQIGAAASAMSSAMTAALEAAISGSEGIGKAARKASAQVLKALAVESAGRAVYEGALALGSLAIGNVAGASTHGAAAAKFAIAAAVTGAGAAALGSGTGVFQGGGGGGAGAPAGGGFTRAPTAGQNAGGGTNITINFGDGFVGDQRQVADLVAKAVKDSQRRGGSRDSSVRFDG